MGTWKETDLQIHIFLISALVGWRSALRLSRLSSRERAPGTHCIGGLVGPRAGLNNMEDRKFVSLLRLEFLPFSRPATAACNEVEKCELRNVVMAGRHQMLLRWRNERIAEFKHEFWAENLEGRNLLGHIGTGSRYVLISMLSNGMWDWELHSSKDRFQLQVSPKTLGSILSQLFKKMVSLRGTVTASYRHCKITIISQ
jgi:hypothetical protein